MTTLKPPSPATAPAPPKPHAAPVAGADAILRVLEEEGVNVCFGMPGGAILPVYDALARNDAVRHVLVRHEQGAGHMAEGYARSSGRVGVVVATSGPGATNLVTPIANARMDSTPLLCLTGQVASPLIGTDAFQECDIVAVVAPLVKRCWQVRDPRELVPTLREAFAEARDGRPGPVLVDIPRDVQEALAPFPERPAQPIAASAPVPTASAEAMAELAAALEAAMRPILYAGGGAVIAGAGAELLALAEATQVPVVTTLMAKGVVPEDHELCFGCPGMHGGKWANWGLSTADLIVAVGARFDDRVTGRLDLFAPDARVAHLDIDPREISKLRAADIPLLGDLRESLRGTRERLLPWTPRPAPNAAWVAQLGRWRERFPLGYDRDGGQLKPQWVVESVDAILHEHPEVIWTTGVGQHQMWAIQYVRCPRSRRFLTSGGHGTMGFGVPAAVGAQVARPRATVVCIDGDGSFQMTAQELATAAAQRLPIIVIVLNNGGLGMVRQWQQMFHEERISQSVVPAPADCAAIASGYGALGLTVRSRGELAPALARALAHRGPTVLDVQVTRAEALYPMIRPGAAAVEVMEYPGDE